MKFLSIVKRRGLRALAIALSLALLLTMTAVPALAAEDIDPSDPVLFSYSTLDDGSIEITNYKYFSIGLIDIVIPSEIDGKKVSKIGHWAFYNKSELNSVTIPEGVTVIDYYAFYSCVNLKCVNIPESVTEIEHDAFYSCDNLKNITIPKSVTYIGDEALGYKDGQQDENGNYIYNRVDGFKITGYKNSAAYKYAMGNGFEFESLGEISPYVYYENDNKTIEIQRYNGYEDELVIPPEIDGKKVISIGRYAFENCHSLQSVNISEGITSINYFAFYGCENLKNVTVPESVTYIADEALGYKDGRWDENGNYVDNKINDLVITGYKYSAAYSYAYENGFEFVSIGELEPFIYDELDDGSIEITGYKGHEAQIVIPAEIDGKSVSKIGEDAFKNNLNVTSVNILKGVSEIGISAFKNCASLTSVNIPDSVTVIGSNAFESCTGLTNVTISERVTSINYHAFYGCENLKNVTVPESVTYIADEALGYKDGRWDENGNYVDNKINDLVITGYKYSAAYSYAYENGFEFVSIGELEPFIYDELDDGSIEITGYKGHEAQIVIPPEIDGKRVGAISDLAFGENKNFESVIFPEGLLDSSMFNYSEPKIIPCEAAGGIYFLSNKKLILYNPESREGRVVYNFDGEMNYIESSYAAGEKLYVLGGGQDNKSKIVVYDLASKKVESRIDFEKSADVIGADDSGRIYLAGNIDGNNYIALLSKSGQLLSETSSEERIYYFAGFDSTNGNFYVVGYMNWIYWGYDHDVNVLRGGNVKNNKIALNENYIELISQQYYNEYPQQAELLDGRYLCVDSTINDSLYILDSSSISVDESEGDVIFSVSGRGNSNGYNSCAGTRAVYLEREDSILAVVNDDEIMEFSLSGKGYGTKITAAHPIFALLKYKDGVVAIEKDGEGYYYEYFSWKKATSVEITGDAKSMKVGDSAKLTAKTNGELDEELTWESENPQIASVTGDGEVYAWKKGTVKITASTKGGATAAYEVKVTVDSDVKDPKNEAVKTSGQKTYNVSDNNYFWYWSATINSYLVQNSDNTLSRIEYIDSEEGVLIETYTADGSKLKSSQKVKAELPIFGGFYSGKDYNYLAFGQENPNESDDREVVRIVKYSKDWKKISSTSIKGANTYIPFDAGTLRMTETDGKLYVYTCHEMYSEGDGVHHQANMIFVINESDMTVVDSHYDVMNISVGYVSHSFNQFIKTDGKSIFRVDHGDAYPRAISIIKSDVDGAITDVDYSLPLEISGNIGYNFTGTTVGGFELSANECIIVGSSVDHESENVDLYGTKNIFVSITDKDFSKDKLIWLTAYKESSNIQVGNPQLVKINDGQFFVMWEETNEETNSLTTKMLTIDTNGNKTSRVISKSMSLSDCQPILCSDGLIRWYATNDSSPTIYAVNPYNLDSAMLGDVNGDGAVDAKDRMTITRHIAKWKGYESIDKTAADVNSDGAIDAKDRMVITRHIAKWKGYEALPYTG